MCQLLHDIMFVSLEGVSSLSFFAKFSSNLFVIIHIRSIYDWRLHEAQYNELNFIYFVPKVQTNKMYSMNKIYWPFWDCKNKAKYTRMMDGWMSNAIALWILCICLINSSLLTFSFGGFYDRKNSKLNSQRAQQLNMIALLHSIVISHANHFNRFWDVCSKKIWNLNLNLNPVYLVHKAFVKSSMSIVRFDKEKKPTNSIS